MFTNQEKSVIEFLTGKKQVYWEELVQFCKNPSTIKDTSIKRLISGIKKKYKDNGISCPIVCEFKYLEDKPVLKEVKKQSILLTEDKIILNGQVLKKIQKPEPNKSTVPQTHLDFQLRKVYRQIRTKTGDHLLGAEDFEIFEYLHNKVGEVVSLEELRDQVVFPKYGSKLPARWFDAIQRRVNNIRRAIPETKGRLLTVKIGPNETGYMLK